MPWSYSVLDPVSQAYPKVQGRSPTCYSPVRHSSTPERAFPFDLHVLSTPPAFVLSQNQTLQTKTTHPQAGRIRIRKIRSQTKTPKTGIQKHPPLNGKKRQTKTTTNKNHQTHY